MNSGINITDCIQHTKESQKGEKMSRSCEICGKSVVYGKSGIHKHSGLWHHRAPKTARQWKPNLKTVRVMVDGQVKKIKICAQCLKSSKIMGKETGTNN